MPLCQRKATCGLWSVTSHLVWGFIAPFHLGTISWRLQWAGKVLLLLSSRLERKRRRRKRRRESCHVFTEESGGNERRGLIMPVNGSPVKRWVSKHGMRTLKIFILVQYRQNIGLKGGMFTPKSDTIKSLSLFYLLQKAYFEVPRPLSYNGTITW